MQSKIAHKAERAAFGLALDQIIKAASGPDREKNLDKLLDMAGNLLKDTAPGAIRGVRNGLYPGSKWEQFLWDVIDNTDHHVQDVHPERCLRGRLPWPAQHHRQRREVPVQRALDHPV